MDLKVAVHAISVEGRPDRKITDSTRILQIWIEGKPILEK